MFYPRMALNPRFAILIELRQLAKTGIGVAQPFLALQFFIHGLKVNHSYDVIPRVDIASGDSGIRHTA